MNKDIFNKYFNTMCQEFKNPSKDQKIFEEEMRGCEGVIQQNDEQAI